MNRIFLSLILCCFCTIVSSQQTVYPGDANANEIVDQFDLLSIGYAFGQTGPARIQTEDAISQGIPLFWDLSFPNGTDFIYADCDGNGIVDYLDFLPLFNNYGSVLDNPSPLVVEPGVTGVDPMLVWNNGVMEVAVTSGEPLAIPISFPIVNEIAVNGVAFNLRYTPGHFQATNFSTEGHWLATDNQAMSMVMEEPGLIQVATTRFGVDPVQGGGDGGTLNLVIIVDMVDLLEAPDDTLITKIYLENILVVDADFNPIPIAADTFNLKLYNDVTSARSIKTPNDLNATVFPNPSNGAFSINTFYDFYEVELVDVMGRRRILYSGPPIKEWTTRQLDLPFGLYSLKLRGREGTSILKVLMSG